MRRIVLPLLLLLAGAALADGGIYVMGSGAGENADQRAIIAYDAATQRETLVVTTQYRGQPADFAWIIPVPALPAADQVSTWAEGNDAFRYLQWQTEPRARVFSGGVGCQGCVPAAGGAADDEATSAVSTGVEVTAKINVDGLAISLLSATDGAELVGWLQTNGYRVPSSAGPVFAQYIQDGWHFVAVKVDTPASAAPSATGYFPTNPLKLTFTTPQPVFPMRISAPTSAPAGSEVLLYVLGPHRMKVDGYPTVAMTETGLDTSSEEAFSGSYAARFTSLLTQPQGRAFVVEHAEWIVSAGASWRPSYLTGLLPMGAPAYLTRLRTVLTPGQMGQDVRLINAPNDESLDIVVLAQHPVGGNGTLALLVACLAMAFCCRRFGWGAKEFLVGVVFLGVLLLVMIW